MIGPIMGVRPRWTGLLLPLVLAATLGASPVWADPIGPTAMDRHVTQAVAVLLKQQHLGQRPLDDEISRRALKTYLKMLDPLKIYFYQSDVDAFNQKADQIDDMIRRYDVSFAYDVFRVFLQRIDERVAMIDKALAMSHDFTIDEELVVDRDTAEYPRTEEEAWQRWRKRIKYDLLVLKADEQHDAVKAADGSSTDTPDADTAPKGFDYDEAVQRLTRRYHSFAKRMHQTDSQDLLEMYLTSVTTAFDPHTSYMSPGTLENFEIAMRLELDGIGAELQSEDGMTIVRNVVPGGAADRDGRLKAEDKIIAVGEGKDGELVDVVDMKLSDVVKLIRGKRGTIVRLQVISADSPKAKTIDITRARIELKDKEAQSDVIEVGKKSGGSPYKIGVIDLPSFYMDMDASRRLSSNYRSTTRDVRRILDDFKAEGVDAVVFDLRRNGGGSLPEAISLTSLFIDDGPIVQVKGPDGEVRVYADDQPGTAWDGPLVVLTSKLSASASEIFAGAIQDYGRGLIVGDHSTHGKGTVQRLLNLADELFRLPNSVQLGALKITMEQFYRPNGDSTQNRGVVADIEWPSLTSHLDIAEADLDYPVAFDKVDAAAFRPAGLVSKPVVDRLRDLSAQRCRDSKDFQKVTRNIQRYQEQKARKTVTLNEQEFLTERAELNADKEEEKTLEELNDPKRPAIVRDFYLDEALAITLDYIQLMYVAQAN